jgi:hypothetical protein
MPNVNDSKAYATWTSKHQGPYYQTLRLHTAAPRPLLKGIIPVFPDNFSDFSDFSIHLPYFQAYDTPLPIVHNDCAHRESTGRIEIDIGRKEP